MSTGVYTTTKKDGSTSYRVSITFRGKHISLGSYDNYEQAQAVYLDGRYIIDNEVSLDDYSNDMHIPFNKFVCLVNFKDNGLYFPNPMYLRKQYFEYYISEHKILKFDRDDIFFYASHKIQQRGGYLFVCDYGSQYKILSRYGIKPFAVYGRDYIMANGDRNDYRYSNIKIINNYNGVTFHRDKATGKEYYQATIHINGNYIIGKYDSEVASAIAYNKAVDTLHTNGFTKAYIKNYISSIKKDEYLHIYNEIKISNKLINYKPDTN